MARRRSSSSASASSVSWVSESSTSQSIHSPSPSARSGALSELSGAAIRRFICTTSSSGDVEPGGDLGHVFGVEVALLDRLDLALDAPQVEEQLLLGGGGADLHQGPGVQDVFLDRRADPPHGIGGEPEPAIRVEPLDRLHHPDIALGNQLAHRQPVAAIARGDLGHQPQMAGHQPVGRFRVAVLAPALGQHELLVRLQDGELADIPEIAREIALRVELRSRGNRCRSRCHRLLLLRPAAAHAATSVKWSNENPRFGVQRRDGDGRDILPHFLQSVFQ